MRLWTDQQRQQAADRARIYRPWASSTGPRTVLGKFRASRNSLKHGRFTYEKKLMRWYLRLAIMRIKQLKTHLNYQDLKRENELRAKWGIPRVARPDIKAFYPYFKVHPLSAEALRNPKPKKTSKDHEIFDYFTSLSDE